MNNAALFIRLDAKPGKEKEVEQFLNQRLSTVENDTRTITWYALKLGPSVYGIFHTFSDEAGRQVHLTGDVAKNFTAKVSELLSKPPSLEKADILAAKVPEMEHH